MATIGRIGETIRSPISSRVERVEQVEKYLVITLCVASVLATLIICFSRGALAQYAGAEQAIRTTSYCLGVPVVVMGISKVLGCFLILFAPALRSGPRVRERTGPPTPAVSPLPEVIAPVIDSVTYMPGKCFLKVQVGDEVDEGSQLYMVEAMKMEMIVRATVSGRVVEVLVEDQALVGADQPIVRIEKR